MSDQNKPSRPEFLSGPESEEALSAIGQVGNRHIDDARGVGHIPNHRPSLEIRGCLHLIGPDCGCCNAEASSSSSYSAHLAELRSEQTSRGWYMKRQRGHGQAGTQQGVAVRIDEGAPQAGLEFVGANDVIAEQLTPNRGHPIRVSWIEAQIELKSGGVGGAAQIKKELGIAVGESADTGDTQGRGNAGRSGETRTKHQAQRAESHGLNFQFHNGQS